MILSSFPHFIERTQPTMIDRNMVCILKSEIWDSALLLQLSCCPLLAKTEAVFLEVFSYYRCQYVAKLWFVTLAEPHIYWSSK